ncbi:hypothetical protein ACUXST_000693 [Sphingomonas sp. F9_3S_D5_B_2]|jgi:hypothetical protein
MTDSRSSTETASTGNPRQRAIEAYESARGSVSNSVSDAPLIALAGGLAAGALIAAILPRTETEDRLVKPTARRVRDSAKAAATAARETGTQRLGELGISREKGEETIRSLLDSVTDAAKASARAAADAAKTGS